MSPPPGASRSSPTPLEVSMPREVVELASVPGFVFVPDTRIAVPVVLSDLITITVVEPPDGGLKIIPLELFEPDEPAISTEPVVALIWTAPEMAMPFEVDEVPAIVMFPPPERILVPVEVASLLIETAWADVDTGPVGKEVPEVPPPM